METYRLWHEFVETQNAEILHEILSDEIKFHSPFVWKPKQTKVEAIFILRNVTEIFRDFRYIRELRDETFWALEFQATVGEGLSLRGIDLISLDKDGKINDFEVMIRPANALQYIGEEMGRRFATLNANLSRNG